MNDKEIIEEIAYLIKLPIENWLEDTEAISPATTYYAELLSCINDSAEVLYNEGFRRDSAEVKFSENSKWIPCSERLPEKAGEYLVTGAWKGAPAKIWICECFVITGISGWVNNAGNPIVSAWMPLPEPYKSN